jgi:putative redox protein
MMTIEVRRKQGLNIAHTLSMGQTTLVVDSPTSDGGDGAGPSPHELYDAALAACNALTVMWYANRKQMPVQDLAVSVDRDNSKEREGVYRLTSRIRIGGPLSDAQIEELRSVAGKCPIHRLMTKVETTIETEVERMT